jgi:hypothetical protein
MSGINTPAVTVSVRALKTKQLVKLAMHMSERDAVMAAADNTFIARMEELAKSFPPPVRESLTTLVDEWSAIINGIIGASSAEIQRIAGLPVSTTPTKQ